MDRTPTLDRTPEQHRLRRLLALAVLWAALVVLTSAPAFAQSADEAPTFTADELETLVARVALYPDDLIGVILPASTYPLQIVQAARFLDDYEDDPSLEPDPAWDDSIVALLNYPEVLRQLDEDLDWTWELGAAVLEDRARVLDAIQDFRDRAFAAGNLLSDDRQIVTKSDEVIEIRPADPEVVYVPVYEPRRVVVYNAAPVIRYHPWAYPVYYYPYPAGFRFGYSFRHGFFWGVTTAFSIGWHTHHLHVYHHDHVHHPYYRRRHVYSAPHFARRSVSVHVDVGHSRPIWRPSHRVGPRPHQRVTVSRGSRANEVRTTATGRRVAGAEGYTNGAQRARATSRSSAALRPTREAARATGAQTSRARREGLASGTQPQSERTRALPRASAGETLRPSPRARSSASDGARRAGDAASTRTPQQRATPRTREAARASAAPRFRAPATSGRVEQRAAPQPRARDSAPAQRSTRAPITRAPSRSTPSRSAPSRSAPSRSAPSRSAPSRSAPSRSAPSARTRAPAPRAESRSAPSRSRSESSRAGAARSRAPTRTRQR